MDRQAIFDTLEVSNASLRGEFELPSGIKLAAWENELDLVCYHTDQVHTLSLYTNGGEFTRRVDGYPKLSHGFKDAICILPQQHESIWEVRGKFQFTHVYFSDNHFREFIARELDREPLIFSVPDLSFLHHASLAQTLDQLGQPDGWDDEIQQLRIQDRVQDMFALLCSLIAPNSFQKLRYTGGLSRHVQKRVREYIDCNLYRKITISEIAEAAGLSEFHFSRVFRQSFHTSVYRYIEHERVQRVTQLLAKGDKLIDIADRVGFSDQSHLCRVVKKHTGTTPKVIRRYLALD